MKPKSLVWFIHDDVTAFEHLASAGRTFHMMSERHIVHPYAKELAVSAIAYTVQIAIDTGADVDAMRELERKLIDEVSK